LDVGEEFFDAPEATSNSQTSNGFAAPAFQPSVSSVSNAFGAISFAPTTTSTNSFAPTTSSNILKPKKMGAKKAATKINFEEAEKRAKEEQERIKLAEAEKLRLESIQPVKATSSYTSNSYNNASSNYGAPAAAASKPPPAPKKFGFGFDPSDMPVAESTPVFVKKAPTGFGNQPAYEDKSAPVATARFGNSKSISSDQYFNRGDFDPNAPPSDGSGPSGMSTERRSSIVANAADFATQFSSQAQEDFESVKRLVSTGGAKLGEMLADIQVAFTNGRVDTDNKELNLEIFCF
jgi:ADP-ribosylation factor GTPase-activating protein 2/3